MRKDKRRWYVLALGGVALATLGWLSRPRSDVRLRTTRIACESLVSALRSGDQQRVEEFTTAQGLANIQKASRNANLRTPSKLADRIKAEWLDDNSLKNLDYNIDNFYNRKGSWRSNLLPQWLHRRVGTGMRFYVTHGSTSGKADEGIGFVRTPQGFKINRYKPMSTGSYQQYRIAVEIQQQ